jgi:hypothetical protein
MTIADEGTAPGGVESGSEVGGCEIAPTVGMLGRLRVGASPPAQPESSTPATSANGTFDVQRYAIALRLIPRRRPDDTRAKTPLKTRLPGPPGLSKGGEISRRGRGSNLTHEKRGAPEEYRVKKRMEGRIVAPGWRACVLN